VVARAAIAMAVYGGDESCRAGDVGLARTDSGKSQCCRIAESALLTEWILESMLAQSRLISQM